ncbi:YdcH family protein [Hyphococcus sp.]|uniref:YdcH family protein n=1 Tax=Hyphococcus sp. TaxID=2038636 RepID=UPI003CCB9BB0
MTDEKPPANGDEDEADDTQKPTFQRGDPPARLTATLLSNDRFAARDSDFDGANDEALTIKLAIFEQEHRDLDAAITSLEQNSPYERLTIARLKKKKLSLKDAIQEIKDAMLPDIIA